MTSAELKRKKMDLIRNIDSFIEKYNSLNNSVKNINNYLTSTEDSMLNNEVLSQSENIASVINKTINEVQAKKATAIAKIDQEIRILEEQERKALLKRQQEEKGELANGSNN